MSRPKPKAKPKRRPPPKEWVKSDEEIERLMATQGITAPQDLNKLIGAGRDFWESDEDLDEWLRELRERRQF